MYISNFLIPKYYDFSEEKIKSIKEKNSQKTLPILNKNVRFLILANDDLLNDAQTQFTNKMNTMCGKLNLKEGQWAIMNEYLYPSLILELPTKFPQVKYLLMHGVDVQKYLQRSPKNGLDFFIFDTIKVVSAPKLGEIEADLEMKKVYWTQLKNIVK